MKSQSISMGDVKLTYGTELERSKNGISIETDENGARLSMFPLKGIGPDKVDWHKAKYFVFDIALHGEISHLLAFSSYATYNKDSRWPDNDFRFSILPEYPTRICIPLKTLKGKILFILRTPGLLISFATGKPVEIDDVAEFSIRVPAYPIKTRLDISNICLTDKKPEFLYPKVRLMDEMGQYAPKQWPGKMPSFGAMKQYLENLLVEAKEYDFSEKTDRSKYGGWLKKRFESTGYFRTEKDNGRWWMVDPDGYAFLSVGPDAIGNDRISNVKGLEHTLDWHPSFFNLKYLPCRFMFPGLPIPFPGCFDYPMANLIKVYGKTWFEDWALTVKMRMHQWGYNTVANWPDARIPKALGMPYVTQLDHFPSTRKKIYRELPDMFSEEYEKKAEKYAKQLKKFDGDKLLLGYFMTNEPTWAYEETLIVAEEMLANPNDFVTKDVFINELKEKYGNIESLNFAWNTEFVSFDDLRKPHKRLSSRSDIARKDLIDFSKKMISRFIEIPAKACKAVDPHHLNIGVRWGMIHNTTLLCGSEFLDVFSMNRYAETPVPAIEDFMERYDMPLMIGEYHMCATDRGHTSPGHIQYANQEERGKGYQYYTETAFTTPVCVGAHYFTYNDQSPIGRFNGENFPHGLVDCCQQVYTEFADHVSATNERIYEVADGRIPATKERGEVVSVLFK